MQLRASRIASHLCRNFKIICYFKVLKKQRPFLLKIKYFIKNVMQISIDKNVISELKRGFSGGKLSLTAKSKGIVLHLTESLLEELLLDGNDTRKAKQAGILKKIFNGKFIPSLPNLIRYELKGNNNTFYTSSGEIKLNKLLKNIAQQKSLSNFGNDKVKESQERRRLYNEDLKVRQEDNLREFRERKREIKKKSGEETKQGKKAKKLLQQLESSKFNKYYNACPREWKCKKLKCFFELNKIYYDKDICQYIENKSYSYINWWVRGWFTYHYYTAVKRGQSTLRNNDASDLDYIVPICSLDHFITNDKEFSNIGNMCYGKEDKFIALDKFISKYSKQ